MQSEKGGTFLMSSLLHYWGRFIHSSVALLGDEDEEVVPEEEKMTFHAKAELGVRPPPFTPSHGQVID